MSEASKPTIRPLFRRIGYSHSLCRGFRFGVEIRGRRYWLSVTRWLA